MKDFDSIPDILDVSDVQHILNIGRRQAYKLTVSGLFHSVRIGSRIKIPKCSFLAWLTGRDNS